jgi:MoaA/NifB/PqqE/SkfB family radical SAM enzyme
VNKIIREIQRPFWLFRERLHRWKYGQPQEQKEQSRYQQWRDFLNDERLFTADKQAAKELFRKYIARVEIEVHSFCNRQCPWCANTYIDRHSNKTLMPPEMYRSIIDQLAEIGYSKSIWYSRYNEPLADRVILDRLREAKTKLPKATLATFTNGDYVTREYLDELAESGLDRIFIMRYPSENTEYKTEQKWKTLTDFAEKLHLPFHRNNEELKCYCTHPKLEKIEIHWFEETKAINRGGSVLRESPVNKRTAPCSFPFTNMYIDYEGSVLPCCNVRHDVPEQKEIILGNAAESSIFDIYTNLKSSLLRFQMVDFSPKVYPCGICDNYVQSYYFSIEEIYS